MKTSLHLLLILLLTVTTALAQGPPRAARVRLAEVTEKNAAEQAGIIGVLYFDRVSQVSTEVAGMVQEVHFREGDQVDKGDDLVTLNTDFLERNIALEEAKLAQNEVQIQKTKKNLDRYEKLFKREAASEIDYDELYFALQEQVKEKEITEENLKKIRLQLDKSIIHAPFDGLVLEKGVDVGDWVVQGRTICRVASAEELFVKVPITEDLLQYAGRNETVDVILNAFDTEKLTGVVEGIIPVADEKTKNVFMKVRLGDIASVPVAVAENMSATVYLPISEEKQLKIIPRDALVKHQGQNFVYTIQDGKATIMPVNIVAYMGDEIGVDSPNIEVGMPVVVDGNERLQPDQPVEILGGS